MYIPNPFPEGSPQYWDFLWRQIMQNQQLDLQAEQNRLLGQIAAAPVGPTPAQQEALNRFIQVTWTTLLSAIADKHSLALKAWGLARILVTFADRLPELRGLTGKLMQDRQVCAAAALDTAAALRRYGVRPQFDELVAEDQVALARDAGA